ALACAALGACNPSVETRPVEPCGDGGVCFVTAPPYAGIATLRPHTSDADYLGSVVSFKHATTVDDGEVNNDWDLSLDSVDLRFRVNTVTDDTSWIVDLGPISLEDVPETVDPNDFPVGIDGTHDFVPAALEHVYLVRNQDPDTEQFAAFRVVGLERGASVTLQWFRSKEAERFVFPRGETL
ncbi:MAG TPA: hypothetical protein VGK67_30030, partial [Myxococcales bacterium]